MVEEAMKESCMVHWVTLSFRTRKKGAIEAMNSFQAKCFLAKTKATILWIFKLLAEIARQQAMNQNNSASQLSSGLRLVDLFMTTADSKSTKNAFDERHKAKPLY